MIDTHARILRSSLGRALEDDELRRRLDDAGDMISFCESGYGWFVLAGDKVLVSGPRGSRALGAELFRRWTGKEVSGNG